MFRISLLLFIVQWATAIAASDEDRFAAIKSSCFACHGASAQGSKALNAPGLTNLEYTYFERQLRNFRDGIRGSNLNDTEGKVMSLAVQSYGDETIRELARVFSALPDVAPVTSLEGDPITGKSYYGHQCGACHGPDGSGIAAIGAPRLAGLEDWYMASQLEKFQSGLRGNQTGDTYGQQMAFIMKRLKNREDILDIIAYLQDPSGIQ